MSHTYCCDCKAQLFVTPFHCNNHATCTNVMCLTCFDSQDELCGECICVKSVEKFKIDICHDCNDRTEAIVNQKCGTKTCKKNITVCAKHMKRDLSSGNPICKKCWSVAAKDKCKCGHVLETQQTRKCESCGLSKCEHCSLVSMNGNKGLTFSCSKHSVGCGECGSRKYLLDTRRCQVADCPHYICEKGRFKSKDGRYRIQVCDYHIAKCQFCYKQYPLTHIGGEVRLKYKPNHIACRNCYLSIMMLYYINSNLDDHRKLPRDVLTLISDYILA